ncbi:hypothetical protein [Algoriphagus namhaensis]
MANLFLLVAVSCVSDPTLEDPFGSCPEARDARAIGLSVFYSPYKNSAYSSASDTVSLSDFAFNLEIKAELMSSLTGNGLPGQAYALSCLAAYNFKNISAISVILNAPFNGLPTGTDISYLFLLPNDESLADLKVLNNSPEFISTRLNMTPANYSQLATKTFLFLRDGSQIVFESKSPVLKTN